jgi:hypothetical protein
MTFASLSDQSVLSRHTLPPPPRYDQIPPSVQSALRLRGGLVPCGPGVRGVGWPDSASVRLTALAPLIAQTGLIASHLTAAWVWGTSVTPGSPLCTAVPAGLHPRINPPPGTRRFQLRFSAEDLTSLASLKITTPLRTALDLLYTPGRFGCAESLACQLLVRLHPDFIDQLRRKLVEHRRPHRNLARSRAASLFDQSLLRQHPARDRAGRASRVLDSA